MVFHDDFQRLLHGYGFAIWASVGLPVLVFQIAKPAEGRQIPPVAAWAAAYLLFAAALGLATSRRAGGDRWGAVLLAAAQTAAVLCLMALPPCFGLEGALMVVVALELEVLRLLTGGSSNREIARALSVAEGTVKNHVLSIHSKLGVRDRTRAVLQAAEAGSLS
jgi:DNA-binding CsgD family transcriptional regulator